MSICFPIAIAEAFQKQGTKMMLPKGEYSDDITEVESDTISDMDMDTDIKYGKLDKYHLIKATLLIIFFGSLLIFWTPNLPDLSIKENIKQNEVKQGGKEPVKKPDYDSDFDSDSALLLTKIKIMDEGEKYYELVKLWLNPLKEECLTDQIKSFDSSYKITKSKPCPKLSQDKKIISFYSFDSLDEKGFLYLLKEEGLKRISLPRPYFDYCVLPKGEGLFFTHRLSQISKVTFKKNMENIENEENSTTIFNEELGNSYKNFILTEKDSLIFYKRISTFKGNFTCHVYKKTELNPKVLIAQINNLSAEPILSYGKEFIFASTGQNTFLIWKLTQSKKDPIIKTVSIRGYEQIFNVALSNNGTILYVMARKSKTDTTEKSILSVGFNFESIGNKTTCELSGNELITGDYEDDIFVI